MLRVAVLASGSNGNAVYVESETTRLLVDAGVSAKRIEERLRHIGREASDLDAVLLTHEHSDHVAGLRVLCGRHRLPLYANANTFAAARGAVREIERRETVRSGESFRVGDCDVTSIRVSHDAAEPVCYVIESRGVRFGVFTDLGVPGAEVEACLATLDGAVVETNHDVEMLKAGPYPETLKTRIASSTGHLSNVQARDLLVQHASDRLRCVFLGHLSEENNTAMKALAAAREAAAQRRFQDRLRPILSSRFATTALIALAT
jgi:phosphoribosyl 1,2-cyclic phosphodiesterase